MNPLQRVFCVILVIFLSAVNAWSWGSFETVQAFSTHQFLNKTAYEKLSEHPAFSTAGFPALSSIQRFSGVSAGNKFLPEYDQMVRDIRADKNTDIDVLHLFGRGPDADGNSDFSEHWYNAGNRQGKAPAAIEKYYTNLKKTLLMAEVPSSYKPPEPVAKSAAYSAHYIQDMTCPMHVSGMFGVSKDLLDPVPSLRSKNISPYKNDYTPEEWENIVYRYRKSDSDFFDPLYYDDSSEIWTTHFQYEARVEIKYHAQTSQKEKDAKWLSLAKQEGFIPDAYTRSGSIAKLAKKEAALTRKRIGTKNSPGPLWMNPDWMLSTLPVPYEDWWRAIQLTYVTWRSSFSALHVQKEDVKFVKVPNQPKQWELQMAVSNLEPESEVGNVQVGFIIDGDIAVEGKAKISKTIPESGKSDWVTIGKPFQITDDPENLMIDLQIDLAGNYRDKKLPDSEEKHLLHHAIDIAIDDDAFKMPAISATQGVEDIKNMLADEPYNFVVTTRLLGAANTRALANTVKTQIPAANEWVAKGDNIVLEVYGPFVKESADAAADAAADAIQKLNTELAGLHGLALQWSGDICAAASSVSATQIAINEKIRSIQKEVKTLEGDLRDAEKTMRNLDGISAKVESAHGNAESLTTSIADASSLAEEHQVLVCQATATMNESKTNRERDQCYDQAYTGYTECKATFERARVDYRELEKVSSKVAESRESLAQAQKLTQEMATIPAELLTARNDVTSYQSEIDSQFETALSNFSQLESVANSAESLGTRIKQAFNPKAADTAGEKESFVGSLKDLGRKKSAEEIALKKNQKEISSQLKTAGKCLKKIEKAQQKAQQQSDKLSQRFVNLETKLKKLRQAFLPDETGQLSEPLRSTLEKLNLIDLLSSMGKGYLERCMEQLLKTSLCKTDAEKLSTVVFSAPMPGLRGELCTDATGMVKDYHYQVVSAGQAIHPDWEYRVEGTDPASGAEVSLADSSILISCYEELDIPAYLATIDCSSVADSTAVYDIAARQAVCDCTDGKIWGQSRERCVDCSYYQQVAQNYLNSGDFDAASWGANEASGCSWSPELLSQIASAQQQQLCGEVVANMHSACVNKNARAASGFWKQAHDLNCHIDPQLIQWASNLIDHHNEMLALQAEQEQQQRQEAAALNAQQQQQNQGSWMDVANAVLSGIKTIQDGHKPSSGGGVPSTGSTSGIRNNGGNSSSGNGASTSSTKCSGHTNVTCGGSKVDGRPSLDTNRDGTCDICRRACASGGKYFRGTATASNCQEVKGSTGGAPTEINLFGEVSPAAIKPNRRYTPRGQGY